MDSRSFATCSARIRHSPWTSRVVFSKKARSAASLPRFTPIRSHRWEASRLAAELGAVTAEHLEHIDAGGIAALEEASVIAGLIPGCSFYLGVPQAPARKLIEHRIPIAVSTDYNPGSSVVESLPLVLSIACTQAKMAPSEALVGATVNAAAALDRGARLGRIEKRMQADLVVLDVPSVDQWLYQVGRNAVTTVIKNGRIVHQRAS